jgi:hypothetical protein
VESQPCPSGRRSARWYREICLPPPDSCAIAGAKGYYHQQSGHPQPTISFLLSPEFVEEALESVRETANDHSLLQLIAPNRYLEAFREGSTCGWI